MRKAPESIAPEPLTFDAALVMPGMVREERAYDLITPLFGGGVEAGVSDPLTLIRGPSIRGQLRFWWRATQGGRFNGDLKAMRAEEARIWGAANDNDRSAEPVQTVQLAVELSQEAERPKYVQAYDVVSRNGRPVLQPNSIAPAYASFPLQPQGDALIAGMATKKVASNIFFSLTLLYPEAFRSDVTAALWAWETFGGVGGRTRRGFGALKPNQSALLPKDRSHVCEWLVTHWKAHVVGSTWPDNVPNLGPGTQLVVAHDNAQASVVWKALIKTLSDFRQQRAGQYGRSYWPEPDAIRKLTGQTLRGHNQPMAPHPDGTPIGKFPRAVFGLPIVFHFKDSDKAMPDRNGADPRDTMLVLQQAERLASPLILRPGACSDGSYYGIALVLGSRLRSNSMQLKLKTTKGQPASWPKPAEAPLAWRLTQNELDQLVAAGLQSNQLDPIQALLDRLGGDRVALEGEA